jgi:hypothetical protein
MLKIDSITSHLPVIRPESIPSDHFPQADSYYRSSANSNSKEGRFVIIGIRFVHGC